MLILHPKTSKEGFFVLNQCFTEKKDLLPNTCHNRKFWKNLLNRFYGIFEFYALLSQNMSHLSHLEQNVNFP